MSANSFGRKFILTTFGESHGDYVGGVIEGCPSGLKIDIDLIKSELERRKISFFNITTERKEEDNVIFVSGIENGITLGTPISFFIQNKNINKEHYKDLIGKFRPSHADYTYYKKYGIVSQSGGGRASARETVSRVVAGAVAKEILKQRNIEIVAQIDSIGKWEYPSEMERIEKEFEYIKEYGDSIGGSIRCKIKNAPAGLGEPVFDKLNALLAKAMMSIPGAKAFEVGDGFEGCKRYGSEQLDLWEEDFSTKTNHQGGLQGGISNGMDIDLKVGFKPVASLMREIPCIDQEGKIHNINIEGRHDKCLIPRAVVVVEAMAALVIVDAILMNNINI